MSWKKFVVYSTAGEKKEFHITGVGERPARFQALNYYEELLRNHRNDGVEVIMGREEWYRITDNRRTV